MIIRESPIDMRVLDEFPNERIVRGNELNLVNKKGHANHTKEQLPKVEILENDPNEGLEDTDGSDEFRKSDSDQEKSVATKTINLKE